MCFFSISFLCKKDDNIYEYRKQRGGRKVMIGIIISEKKNTYALKTPHVVALPFIYGVKYIVISNQMNGPQRTAVFRKEFLSYSSFGYQMNLSVPCLTWSAGPLP